MLTNTPQIGKEVRLIVEGSSWFGRIGTVLDEKTAGHEDFARLTHRDDAAFFWCHAYDASHPIVLVSFSGDDGFFPPLNSMKSEQAPYAARWHSVFEVEALVDRLPQKGDVVRARGLAHDAAPISNGDFGEVVGLASTKNAAEEEYDFRVRFTHDAAGDRLPNDQEVVVVGKCLAVLDIPRSNGNGNADDRTVDAAVEEERRYERLRGRAEAIGRAILDRYSFELLHDEDINGGDLVDVVSEVACRADAVEAAVDALPSTPSEFIVKELVDLAENLATDAHLDEVAADMRDAILDLRERSGLRSRYLLLVWRLQRLFDKAFPRFSTFALARQERGTPDEKGRGVLGTQVLSIRGTRDDQEEPSIVVVDDGRLVGDLPHASHHSPTGMEWGYGGSGPHDLALSMIAYALLEPIGSEDLRSGAGYAYEVHGLFAEVVARFPRAGFSVTVEELLFWTETAVAYVDERGHRDRTPAYVRARTAMDEASQAIVFQQRDGNHGSQASTSST